MDNCKVIAITNLKGGVGKTTTAVDLGVGLAGLETVKAESKELPRDEAIILMVESDLQRSMILPGEKVLS